MRVAFRSDGSTQMGVGHAKRCASLAGALAKAGATIAFVHRDLGIDLRGVIGTGAFTHFCLPAPGGPMAPDSLVPHSAWAQVPEDQDAEETVAALAGWAPDWVIVDHYAFDARWHDRVREALGCRLAAIDDLGDRALAVDLIVDQNTEDDHAAKYAKAAPGTRILAGPRFALLAAAYVDAPRYEMRDAVGSIGIFMGGSDPADATSMAWTASRDAGFDGPIEIATTSANPHLEALRRRAATDANVVLTVDQPDLIAFFARHDIQIGAGGGASWERCCVGPPSLVVATTGNQVVPLGGLERAEAGLACALDRADMAAAVARLIGDARLRRSLSENSRRLVDGRGCDRVAMVLADEVSLRAATPADSGFALAWRNHPETRRYFRDPRALERGEHEAWWARAIASADRSLLVASVGALPVGILRLDHDGESAECSIYVDPALSGLGLGRKLLSALIRRATDMPSIDRLTAEILPENRASQAIFAAGGFVPQGAIWVRPLRA